MKAALAQLAPKLRDKEANLAAMERAVAKSGADLVAFGELFLTGYMARDALPRLAETVPGPATDAVVGIAEEHGAHVLFGMPERDPKARHLYNAAVLVRPDGAVHTYRKIHPANFGPFEEGLYFGRGSDVVVVETEIGRIGLMVCYDTFFPELAKACALKGADVLAIISAAPATSKPLFDKVLPARAVENAVFVLYTNLVGTELNMVFQGGTQAIGPRGEDLGRARSFRQEVVPVDVDLGQLPSARELRPTIRDTKRELWEGVAPRAAKRPGRGKAR